MCECVQAVVHIGEVMHVQMYVYTVVPVRRSIILVGTKFRENFHLKI